MATINDNIFFVGLMGAGKTTIGKLLAKKLKKTFYDTDHEIEKKLGVKVSVIFELEGEEGFRKRETQMIDELTNKKDSSRTIENWCPEEINAGFSIQNLPGDINAKKATFLAAFLRGRPLPEKYIGIL